MSHQEFRDRLARRLAWQRAAHDAVRDPRNLLPQLSMLRQWQSKRLAESFTDFLADARMRPAAEFFLADLYGDKDFSARDRDAARVLPLMSRLLPDTVSALASHPRIVGIKEARNDAERIAAVIALKSPQFSVLSGDDATCMQAMLDGADGVISVAANAAPGPFRELCDAARGGDAQRARRVDRALAALVELTGAEPNPIPVKWCLHLLGIGSPELRLPLMELSAAHRERAARVIAALPGASPARHSDAA